MKGNSDILSAIGACAGWQPALPYSGFRLYEKPFPSDVILEESF